MITVITGPMFASKSKRLIQYLTGALTRNIPVVALKPEQDDRNDSASIYSYDGSAFPAATLDPVLPWRDVRSLLEATLPKVSHLLALDEAQFVSGDIIDGLVQTYLRDDSWLILSGLTEDSDGNPFGHLPSVLEEYPSRVYREVLTARCSFCHGVATKTHCKVSKGGQILTGRDIYEPRCLPCWKFGQAAEA